MDRLQSDEDGVLTVVEHRPEGIRLVDIGNELGVDWRTLIETARLLLDLGKIERIDNVYYPKGSRPQLKEADA